VYTVLAVVVQAESALDLQQTYIVALEAQMRGMSRPAASATATSPSTTATAADAAATETTAGEDTSSSSEADKAAAAAAESSEAAAATAAENARAAEAESTALQQLSDRIAELQRKHICSTTSSTTCCQRSVSCQRTVLEVELRGSGANGSAIC
jgi:hypothetical protein